VSEVAGGVPLQIQEVVEQLVTLKKLRFVAPEDSEDGRALCVCAPAEELHDHESTPIPEKILNAADRFYTGLSERDQLFVKVLSPIPSFSIDMAHRLLSSVIRKEDEQQELTAELVLVVLKDLVKLGVFSEVPEVTAYLRAHDPCPKEGYVFASELVRRQVQKVVLQKDRDTIDARMAELRAAVDEHRKKEDEHQQAAERSKKLEAASSDAAGGAAAVTVSLEPDAPKRGGVAATLSQRLRIRARFRRPQSAAPPDVQPAVSAASCSSTVPIG